jgi:two-component sensor histidine kinase
MRQAAAERFSALPTAAKLFLILGAALLPIGLGLVYLAHQGIDQANRALRLRSDEQARAAAGTIESIIARNALALRIAGNGALSAGAGGDPCARARRSLSISPGVAQTFELESADGRKLCAVGDLDVSGQFPVVAPGDIRLRVVSGQDSIAVRVGLIGGMASGAIKASELRAAIKRLNSAVERLSIRDGDDELILIDSERGQPEETRQSVTDWPIGRNELTVQVIDRVPTITTIDRLMLLLPLAMWIIAALMSWVMVSRLLIRPLKRLQRAVSSYRPGDSDLSLPQKVGPSREIQELRDAFARAVARVEQSENDMGEALEGQRKLVREVHHRVKNNLQVVASLLSIHGRSAATGPARDAYAAISRRVGALSVVHRNHFAEMEGNPGIALRPLLTELAAELRAGAPDPARALNIELDVEAASTTQDAAVAIAFLVTEVVEFAMLHAPAESIEITLRRAGDLTARLAIASAVLVPDEVDGAEKGQFERIIAGLAKQLRSPLERKLGRYSVDLPVFPIS